MYRSLLLGLIAILSLNLTVSFQDEVDICSSPTGEVLLEDDMLLSTEVCRELRDGPHHTSDSGAETSVNDSSGNRSKRKATFNVYLWPNKTLIYHIDPSLSIAARVGLTLAIKHWTSWTCLKFQEVDLDEHENLVHIFPGNGCYSHVGLQGGIQHMSLGKGCSSSALVTHELGHALGWYHEQNRPERDDFIDILTDNIQDGMHYNFQTYRLKLMDDRGVPYNANSLMHYDGYVFSKNGKPTILSKATKLPDVGSNGYLTQEDIELALRMYNCERKPCNTPPACQNGGSVNYRCECVCPKPWEGDLCQTCSPLLCENDGTPDPTCSHCKCKEGSGGVYCTEECRDGQPNCPIFAKLGYCGKSNTYYKSVMQSCRLSCDLCECRKQCANGGHHNWECDCTCNNSWAGDQCQDCRLQCQNGGTPDKDCLKCRCPTGFAGKLCDARCMDYQPFCTILMEREHCNSYMPFRGYMLETCRKSCNVCECLHPCKNGGKLNQVCECECPYNWSGDQCEVCNKKCTNGSPDKQCTNCVCEKGFTGPTCQEACRDLDKTSFCEERRNAGYCNHYKYKDYMNDYCADTCGLCPTTHPPTQIPEIKDITCYNDRGASYKGTVSYMGSGKVCSPWAGRHVHGITSGVSLDSNYCRNPDGSAKPWCFVNETGRGWEFCESIRRCGSCNRVCAQGGMLDESCNCHCPVEWTGDSCQCPSYKTKCQDINDNCHYLAKKCFEETEEAEMIQCYCPKTCSIC